MRQILACDFKSHYGCDALFFSGDRIFVDVSSGRPFVKFEEGINCLLGKIDAVFLVGDALIVMLKEVKKGHRLSERAVRGYLTEVVDEDAHVLLRFFGWVSWYNRNRYCSCCGHVTQLVVNQSEKRCVSCGLSSYPSWSLAIMVLLKKGRQVLLARSPWAANI